jgi:hypothetical protein
MFQQLGNRRWQAVLLDDLGRVLSDAGHPLLALECWRAALADMREFGDPRAHDLEQLLAEHQVTSS